MLLVSSPVAFASRPAIFFDGSRRVFYTEEMKRPIPPKKRRIRPLLTCTVDARTLLAIDSRARAENRPRGQIVDRAVAALP
jgi:hypothetical protein